MSKGNSASSSKADDRSDTVKILVKGQDQREMVFRIRRETKLHLLISAYCEQLNLDYRSTRFIHNGNRVVGSHTPHKLKMGNYEEIEALSDQSGGSCRALFTASAN